MLDLFEKWKGRLPPVFKYDNNNESALVTNADSDNEECEMEITQQTIV